MNLLVGFGWHSYPGHFNTLSINIIKLLDRFLMIFGGRLGNGEAAKLRQSTGTACGTKLFSVHDYVDAPTVEGVTT